MDTTALGQSIGFAVFLCALGAFLIFLGRRNNKGVMRSWLIFYGPAAILIAIGIGGSPALYHANATENASTLFEKEIDQTGEKLSFQVEHPHTEHTLEVWPTGYPSGNDEGDADIKMIDSKGKTLFDEKVHFTTDNNGNGNNDLYEWHHETEHFTPTQTGAVAVQVASMTDKISGIHFWIKDPKKTNGKRN